MICPKCGKEIAENSRFCKFCGASIDLGNKGNTPYNASEERHVNERNLKNTAFDWLGKIGTIISGGLVIVSVIMVIGAFLGFFDKNPVPFLVFMGVVIVFGWLADKFPKVPDVVLVIVEIIALIICFNIAGSATASSANAVEMVKSGSPIKYPNITYGEAFDAYFSNPTWEDEGEDEDGNRVVKFTGNCYYDEQSILMEMEFTVFKGRQDFSVSSEKVNGSYRSYSAQLLAAEVIKEAFEEYGR